MIEMCKKHGAPRPVFEEKQGFLVVTFRAPLVAGGAAGTSRREPGDDGTVQVAVQVTAQVAAFCREPQPAKAIMAELGLKHRSTFQANYLAPLMAMDILERTIPDKPRSGCSGTERRRRVWRWQQLPRPIQVARAARLGRRRGDDARND